MEPATLEHSIEIYIGLTVILGGAAAYLMGRNFAENWRPAWTLLLATPGLALGVRARLAGAAGAAGDGAA